MRPEVKRLVELGPLPSESEATQEELQKIEDEYRSIQRPVSDAEARALISLFGPDGRYGLASSILHLIETAPGWPLKDCLVHSENEFIVSLRERAERGGLI